MTRKDFILITEWIRALRHEAECQGFVIPLSVFDHWVQGITNDLAMNNPQFDRQRFLDACVPLTISTPKEDLRS